MNWRSACKLLDGLLLVVVLAAVILSGTRACGEELPEPLRLIKDGWVAETSGGGDQPKVLKLANAEVEYALYYPTQDDLLYHVSYYRVRSLEKTGAFSDPKWPDRHRGHEAVWWFQRQGKSEKFHGRVFVRWSHRSWRSVWLVRRYRWREIADGTPEYVMERGIATRIWSVHALIYAYGQDPSTVIF